MENHNFGDPYGADVHSIICELNTMALLGLWEDGDPEAAARLLVAGLCQLYGNPGSSNVQESAATRMMMMSMPTAIEEEDELAMVPSSSVSLSPLELDDVLGPNQADASTLAALPNDFYFYRNVFLVDTEEVEDDSSREEQKVPVAPAGNQVHSPSPSLLVAVLAYNVAVIHHAQANLLPQEQNLHQRGGSTVLWLLNKARDWYHVALLHVHLAQPNNISILHRAIFANLGHVAVLLEYIMAIECCWICLWQHQQQGHSSGEHDASLSLRLSLGTRHSSHGDDDDNSAGEDRHAPAA